MKKFIVFFIIVFIPIITNAENEDASAFDALEEEFLVEEPLDSLEDGTDVTDNESEQILNLEKDKTQHYVGAGQLSVLDKITARTTVITIPVGTAKKIGNLEILLRLCWRATEDEKLENKVLMEIWEYKAVEEKEKIFFGWMLASSPALSALEHPLYDVTLIECKETPKKNPK